MIITILILISSPNHENWDIHIKRDTRWGRKVSTNRKTKRTINLMLHDKELKIERIMSKNWFNTLIHRKEW